MKGKLAFKLLMRLWIPLLIVMVVAVSGFAVSRLHGVFGSQKREEYRDGKNDDAKPFKPKRLIYEIFGPPWATADINYFDVNSDPTQVNGAHLPWTLKIESDLPSLMGDIVAQGNADQLGCRITIDGVVRAERVSNEVNAYTYCVVKSA